MASFTDIIPKFNPYIQQLPVDAMVRVGMEKQKRYDEGIQKIQTQIDNIAGLDVIRDIDKAYLQSKLNELGNNLRTVAAGDFSNFQLVNSVSGMTNQITKDANVQNAITSTARYRKEVDIMEAARKEGKSSIQNQWDFNTRASNWLNSNEVGQAFRETYTPYTDVKKKWFEVLKSLHSDLKEEDVPYVINKDGSIDYNQTAAAMTRISKEVVSAERIENAIRASLTPDEQNQLSIDGRYEFRGVSKEGLLNRATMKYNSQIQSNDNKIKELEGVANMSTSDPAKRKAALDVIEQLKTFNVKLNESLNEELSAINTDPEAAKVNIYKNGAILQFATGNAWEHNKKNVLSNPVLEAEHWEKEFAQKKAEFNWKVYKDKFDMDMAGKDYQLKVDKQLAELYGVTGGFSTYLGTSTQVKDPITAMKNDVDGLNKTANQSVRELASKLGASIDQVESAIKLYTKADAQSIKDANAVIPVEWRSTVNDIIAARDKAKRIDVAVKNVEAEVRGSKDFKDRSDEVNRAISNLPTLTIGGQTFSQKELFDYVSKIETKGIPGSVAASTVVKTPLTDKEKILLNATKATEGLSVYENFGEFVNQVLGRKTEKNKINEVLAQYGGKVEELSRNFTSKFNEAVNSKLLERSGQYVPTLTPIVFGSGQGDIARRTWEGITSTVLAKYDKDLGGVAGGEENLDVSKARGWLGGKDREKISYNKLTQGDKTFLVMMLGNDEAIIPLTNQEKAQLPVANSNEPSLQYKEVVEAQYMGSGSTNPTGNFEDAFFKKNRIPKAGFNIVGDLSWNHSNNAVQYVNLQLNTPAGVYPLKIDNYPMDRDNAIKFIENLTDEKIKQLYLNSKSIPDDWKEVVRTMK